jgi:hypothetical protein
MQEITGISALVQASALCCGRAFSIAKQQVSS